MMEQAQLLNLKNIKAIFIIVTRLIKLYTGPNWMHDYDAIKFL